MEHPEGNEQQFSMWHLYVCLLWFCVWFVIVVVLFGFFLFSLCYCLNDDFYWRPSGNWCCLSCLVIISLRLLQQSFPQNPCWLERDYKMGSCKKVNFSASWLSSFESWCDFSSSTGGFYILLLKLKIGNLSLKNAVSVFWHFSDSWQFKMSWFIFSYVEILTKVVKYWILDIYSIKS